MVEKYNNTYHRSIKVKPTDARKPANFKHIHYALYAKVIARKATPPKFYVGDKVRIVRKKDYFSLYPRRGGRPEGPPYILKYITYPF